MPEVDQIGYLAEVADSLPGRGYKRTLLEAMDLRPGQRVLDVGCGPGTDLADLARGVGPAGSVIGIDHDPSMIEEARRRHVAPDIELRVGDAHRLPLETGSVDRARTDRVLQHVADPAAVLAELRRVLRPGGLAGLGEPDWDVLMVDPGQLETVRSFNRFVCSSVVRNATIGRRLPRLAQEAGFEVRSVLPETVVFREFDQAERILGLGRNTERAVRSGHLDRAAADRWSASLRERPFLAVAVVFIVVLQAP